MADTFNELYGIPYHLLREAQGMQELDLAFCRWLETHYPEQAAELADFRQSDWADQRYEDWLLSFSPRVAEFLAAGLGVSDQLANFRKQAERDALVFRFQAEFVKKLKHQPPEPSASVTFTSILESDDPEYALAQCWQQADEEMLVALKAWCWQALQNKEPNWPVFHLPERLNLNELIDAERHGDSRAIDNDPRRLRRGFDLTDAGMSAGDLQNHAHYCVYCHDKQGDFCSRGFPVKKKAEPVEWRKHVTGELMLGCPVEEKISQMHQLYAAGDLLAAFAVIMTDNPLCALTGHRICNDCMKSCIYQKQTPVNTPEVETGVVMQVLELRWGVEIYDILMRWNPMRREQAVEQSYSGKNVWVMGLGPAGISAAHHLLMAGCGVVAADGLRIQSLPQAWCEGPIEDLMTIWEPLSSRPIRGFGGVAEYGITVRWNKNFLTLIQLLFQRRPYLSMLGDVRFGGTITVEDVWPMGFDHLCLAVGAGLPRELRIPGSLAPGMRQANDFLMALQLTGAGRPSSQSVLQLRLPAIVIGGGLTGVDTATEAQAYYIQQIEQVERRFAELTESYDEETVWSWFSPDEREILEEWLLHAKDWHAYQLENSPIDPATFLRRYGGVSIVYRKRMEDSPAYRHNHEELQKALEEGVHYRECLQPVAAICDAYGAVQSMRFERLEKTEEGWRVTDDEVTIPARSVLCATGARPNVAYEFEHHGTFLKHNGNYRPHRWLGDHLVLDERDSAHCKSDHIGMLTSYNDGEHRVSLLGDAHPWFHGSVVKAVASGKAALPQILSSIESQRPGDFHSLQVCIADEFAPVLQAVNLISDTVNEWVVRAPWLAKKHKPGQFYRVGRRVDPQAEPMALLAATDPAHPGCLVFWVENKDWQVGDEISVMGPTGVWTKIGAEKAQTIVVVGGFLAAVYLRSVAPAWKAHGHRVVWVDSEGWIAASQQAAPRNDGESVLSSRGVSPSPSLRAQRSNPAEWASHAGIEVVTTPLVEAILNYSDADAIHVIGDKDLLCQVQHARANEWKGKLKEDVYWVGSTYGPMQCMLKGVCAQCLQWQVEPGTNQRKKAVYACSWQHQPMDLIDLNHLEQRQRLKSVQDKLFCTAN
jgi:NADPH-dependent glutamate synthase beta subunit-like oxidoreductase